MSRKGRCHDLIILRDRKLVERWHYWTEIKRRRFDDVIKILREEEFFVGEQTIMQALKKQGAYLDELNKKNKNIKQLTLFENDKTD